MKTCTHAPDYSSPRGAIIYICVCVYIIFVLFVPLCFLTSHNKLTLVLHGGSLVAGDAGVVAVVVRRQVGDAQRAGEVDVVHSHAQADGDRPSVFLPGDVQRPVARHDHAGDEDSLADGETLELKGLNVGGDCGQRWEERFGFCCRYRVLFLTVIKTILRLRCRFKEVTEGT